MLPITQMLPTVKSSNDIFGQGCFDKGMIKATYGTGSSIMVNIGKEFTEAGNGLVTSIAWGISGVSD